jgi:hypothetical protein
MTEAQVTRFKLNNRHSVATQTGNPVEFCVQLNDNKRARLYWSEAYGDYVLAFNINKSKTFIITKQMWCKLRPHLVSINNVLGN